MTNSYFTFISLNHLILETSLMTLTFLIKLVIALDTTYSTLIKLSSLYIIKNKEIHV